MFLIDCPRVRKHFLLVACLAAAVAGGCASTPAVTAIKEPWNAAVTHQRSLLVGHWQGEAPVKGGGHRKWRMDRRADGSFVVEFRTSGVGDVPEILTEYGVWGISGGIYFTITQGWLIEGQPEPAVAEEPSLADAYRIVSLTAEIFEYENLETGNHYTTRKLPDDAPVAP